MGTPSVLIRDYKIESLSVSTRESFDLEKPVICQIGLRFGVAGHPESKNSFKVDLALKFDTEGLTAEPNLPYETEVLLHGYFDSPVVVAPNAVPAPLVLNALMILYGVARGYIGEVTASYQHGHFVIPSILFDDAVDRASRTAGTNVVPVLSTAKQQEQGTAEFFRFMFALEDIARYANLADDTPPRAVVLQRIAELIESINLVPQADDETSALEECRRKLHALQDASNSITGPLAAVVARQLDLIEAGLERIIVASTAKQ